MAWYWLHYLFKKSSLYFHIKDFDSLPILKLTSICPALTDPFHLSLPISCIEVPNYTPRCDESPAQSHSDVCDLLQWNDRAISKGEGTWGEVQGKSGARSHRCSPGGLTPDELKSRSRRLWQCRWNAAYQVSSSETHCPGILLGTGYVDHFCLAQTEIPDFCKESRFLVWTISFAQAV